MVGSVRELVSYRLAMIVGLNDRSGHAHLRETFNITLSEWRVLGNVAALDVPNFSTLAEAMMIDKGQLSRTVAALVSRGLIASTATVEDRRGVTLSLTRAGARFHARVLEFAVERNIALTSCLSQTEQRALDTILGKLAAFVEVEHAGLARGNARDAEAAARKATAIRKSA